MITNFIFNVGGNGAKVRREKLDGRDHLVVPCVMIVNGVHAGSDGPVLYDEQDMAESDTAWNHKPVVVYHPKKGSQHVSAADPVILTNRRVGILLNTRTEDGKQRTEVWLDELKTRQVDKRVLDKLNRGEQVEVSTGLFANKEEKPGEWNGKPYKLIARNYRPDHLAILPDQVGACSIADGAGLLANELVTEPESIQVVLDRSARMTLKDAGLLNNELSLEATRRELAEALAAKFGEPGKYWDGWIEVTYSDKVIYFDRGQSYLIKYTVGEDGAVTFNGAAEVVERVRGYRTPDGKTILDNQSGVITNSSGESTMKKELIDALIANGGVWKEKHRPMLEGMDEAELKELTKKPEPPPAPVVNKQQETVPTVPAPTTPAKPATVEEFLATAPPEIAGLLANGLAAFTAKKTELIANLMGIENNPFSKEYLDTLEVPVLEGMVKLATPKATPPAPIANTGGRVTMFRALPQTPTVNSEEAPKEGLSRKRLKFEPAK